MGDRELEEFKSRIDLRQYAAEHGYTLDRRESWRGSAVMRRAGDKVVIKRDGDGHYVYFSVRDDRDNGSIVDFIQNRQRLGLGEVRKTLRPWLGREATDLPLFPALDPTPKDRMRVEAEYRRMDPVVRHEYLASRGLGPELLGLERFAGRIRMDRRGNAVFPHFDERGICGFELKNRRFTGFAKGGTKGIWASHSRKGDCRLVVAESAIDALSYAALHPDPDTRYFSIGGTVNPQQPRLITAAAAKLPEKAMVIAAMDADEDGAKLAQMVREAVEATGRRDMRLLADCPQVPGADWNDILKNEIGNRPGRGSSLTARGPGARSGA